MTKTKIDKPPVLNKDQLESVVDGIFHYLEMRCSGHPVAQAPVRAIKGTLDRDDFQTVLNFLESQGYVKAQGGCML